jgi:hypothetical protein
MAEFTNAAINPMLDWLVGNATPAAVATRYITVFDGDPTGGGSEVINTISGSANRINMTTAMAAASGGSCVSDADVTFTASAVGAADVDFVAEYDAITGGNLLAYTPVTAKSVGIGDSLRILSGSLTFTIV